jgi:hypothetical protein
MYCQRHYQPRKTVLACVMLALSAALTLSACGQKSENTTSPPGDIPSASPEPAVIVEKTGLSYVPGKYPQATVGVVLKNTSDQDALDLELGVSLTTSSGKIVSDEAQLHEFITVVPAQGTFYWSGSTFIKGGKPVNVEAVVSCGSFEASQLVLPKVTGLKVTKDWIDETQVECVVANPRAGSQLSSDSTVHVVFFGANGKVVGGCLALLRDSLKPGQSRLLWSFVGSDSTPRSKIKSARASVNVP